jgi:valyl-tRNA synthetase
VQEKPSGCFSFVTAGAEYFIPFTAQIDVEAERKKIEEELNYVRGFLKSVESKLNNERFVNNAPPAVLESERKKQSDSLAKIQMMEEQLKGLG